MQILYYQKKFVLLHTQKSTLIKANIILISTFSLNKNKINKTINILYNFLI